MIYLNKVIISFVPSKVYTSKREERKKVRAWKIIREIRHTFVTIDSRPLGFPAYLERGYTFARVLHFNSVRKSGERLSHDKRPHGCNFALVFYEEHTPLACFILPRARARIFINVKLYICQTIYFGVEYKP